MEKGELSKLAEELERQAKTKEDYIVLSDELSVLKDGNIIKMELPVIRNNQTVNQTFPITEYCHKQIADKTKIPMRYYQRMIDEDKLNLLCDNIMTWLPDKEKRFVRLLDTDGDGIVKVRALLSDRYRVIDNYDVLLNAMKTFKNISNNIMIKTATLTETKLYIKATSKELIDEIHKLHGKDIVEGGITISNSEVGAGAYRVVPFMWVERCKNGLMGDESFTKIHLGKERGIGLLDWSDETLELEDRALWSKIEDIIRATFNPEIFRSWVDKINGISTIKLEEPTIAFNNIIKSEKIPEHKRDELLMHFGNEEPTLWGLSASVTRLAQDMPNYDDQIALEEAGRRILDLKPEQICKKIA
jgi:hypothetical protein